MKRSLLVALALLAGCTPIEPPEPAPKVLQAEQALEAEHANSELKIVERLLPSGFIEIGDRDAPVTLLLFTEHHCRYCKEFFFKQFPRLHSDFIENGQVRLQIAIRPLKKYIHSDAALLGLLCGATQGNGIPMHELLFKLGAKDRATLLSQAATLELDLELFGACLDSPDTARTVERQKSIARSLDVTLVPTMFLNGQQSVGLPYYEDLAGQIEQELRIEN